MDLSPYLRFKDPELEEQWKSGRLHPGMVVMVLAAARWHYLRTGKPAVITSLFRLGDKGVHGDWRGSDLRTWELGKDGQQEWEDYINAAFPYDYSTKKKSKTAKVHELRGEDGKSEGRHLHLQTGPLEPKPPKPKTFIEES